MYSYSNIAVDRGVPVRRDIPTGGYADQPDGLGYDWGSLVQGVTNLVSSGAKVGLDLYKNQMQLKQVKAAAALPQAPAYIPAPNVGQRSFSFMPAGVSTGTMFLVGGLVLGGIALIIMKSKSKSSS